MENKFQLAQPRRVEVESCLSTMARFVRAFFVLGAAVAAVANAPSAGTQGWHYQSSARFVVAHAEGERLLAVQVAGELQRLQAEISERLQFQPRRALTVFLCPTQQIFDRLTGNAIPHWGHAVADPLRWRIILKSPGASATNQLEIETIRHELAHLTLAEMAEPHHLPRWFNEGAAIVLAGETRHVSPTVISRAMLTRNLVSFEEIEELLSFPDARAVLAYSESFHAVKFLTQKYGADAIARFAGAIAQQPDSRTAFQHAFGADLWEFEVAYFDHLRQHFRWYFLLDDEFLFGGIILVLVIAGFIVTRIRARRKIAEWEEQELGLALPGAEPADDDDLDDDDFEEEAWRRS